MSLNVNSFSKGSPTWPLELVRRRQCPVHFRPAVGKSIDLVFARNANNALAARPLGIDVSVQYGFFG